MDENEEFNSEMISEEKQSPVEKLNEAVKKIGLMPIAIRLIIIIAFLAINSLPKQAVLNVKVTAFDETSGISDALVNLYVGSSSKPRIETTDESGYVTFNNVPSGADLTIEVDAGSDYKITTASETITID